MLQDFIRKGATDKTVRLRIIDSTDGTPETGVVFNTSGIDLWYRRELSARVAVTEATLAALTTAHSDGGFLHISDGYYRLDLPDAAFATGANYVEFGGTVTGMVVIGGVVKLIDSNLYEDTVRGGFTALPNAAADAAGGLVISDAGGLDADAQRSDVAAILVDTGTTLDGRIPAALVGGRIDANVGAISSDAGAADNAEAFFDGTGYAGTNNVIPTVTTTATATNLTNAPTAGDFTATMKTSIGTAVAASAVASVTGAVGSVTGNVGGNVTGSIGSLAAQAKLDVNAEADTALVDVGLTTTITGRIDAAVTTRASQASVDTIDDFLDTEIAAILAAVDTEVAAIKAKTDSLTFTVANVLDSNIQRVNDVALIGDGDATPWGPA